MTAQGAKKLGFFKADAALIEQLQQRCGGGVTKEAFHAKHGSVEFELSYLPKQQGYVVSVACRLAGRFRITRKGALDRRMEAFVPAIRFRARDARFDRDFNVQTRDLQITSGVLTRQPNRAAVRRLFDRGVQAVHLDGEWVRAIGKRKALGTKPVAEAILGLVEELAVIADAVTAFAARHGARPSSKNDPVVVASWTGLGVLGVLGFAMLIAGAIEYTLVQPARFLLPCALFGLPAVLPVVVALAFAVQRRTSPYGLVRGLAGLSMLVVPLFVSGALLLSNGLFDQSPAEEHVVTVVGKSVKEDKNEPSYHAGLASWWIEGDVRWLNISKATYDMLEPNVSRMQVRTHPGRLGYEWIESYTVEP